MAEVLQVDLECGGGSCADAPTVAAPTPGVACRIFDGEAILVDGRAGLVYMLNQSATRIWSALDGRRSVEEIAILLARTYAIEHALAVIATSSLLDALKQRGLVIWQREGSQSL